MKSTMLVIGFVFVMMVSFFIGINNVALPMDSKMLVFESDSMIPAIYPGSMIFIRRNDWYEVNDVITFWTKINNKEELVTHRIVRLGGNVYVTKGDSNDLSDSLLAIPRLIEGKVVVVVPYMGMVLNFFRSKVGISLYMVVVTLILHSQIEIIVTYLRHYFVNTKKFKK